MSRAALYAIVKNPLFLACQVTAEDCVEIVDTCSKNKIMLAVCNVMRYMLLLRILCFSPVR